MARGATALAGISVILAMLVRPFAVVRASPYQPAILRGVLRFGVVLLRVVAWYVGRTCWLACRLTVCGVLRGVPRFGVVRLSPGPCRWSGPPSRTCTPQAPRWVHALGFGPPWLTIVHAPIVGDLVFEALLNKERRVPEGTEEPRDIG